MKFRLLVVVAIIGLLLAGWMAAWSSPRWTVAGVDAPADVEPGAWPGMVLTPGDEAPLLRVRRGLRLLAATGRAVWLDVDLACALLHFADVFHKPQLLPADRSFFFNTTTCRLWEGARLAQRTIQDWLDSPGWVVAGTRSGSSRPPAATWEPGDRVEGSQPPTVEESENWLHRWLTPQPPVEGNQP